MNKMELLKEIKKIEISYDYDETYTNLYNTCIDYENEHQNFFLKNLFDDIISYDVAEDIAKSQLETGGLIRLYYFLGNANLNNDIFRIDGYGNLVDVDYNDLVNLKDSIIEEIEIELAKDED